MMRTSLLFVSLLAACGGASESGEPGGPGEPGEPGAYGASAATPAEAVAEMRSAIESLEAAPEHGDEEIELQHVLIGIRGAPRMPQMTRSKEDAEKLAAEIFVKAKAGEDFTALMREHSDDPGPGIYPMKKAERRSMVPGFGNVGFRLQVGQIGVAPHHATDSPYGWHVIKRLK